MTTGQKIKFRREQLGMTQRDLAAKMGYGSNSTIKRIESDEISVSLTKIELFAQVLNVPLSWLCGYDEKEPVVEPERDEISELLKTATQSERDEIAKYIKFVLSQRE